MGMMDFRMDWKKVLSLLANAPFQGGGMHMGKGYSGITRRLTELSQFRWRYLADREEF